MKASPVSFLLTAVVTMLFLVTPLLAAQQGSAVDARGVRHDASDYSGKDVPWRADIIKSVAPEYYYDIMKVRAYFILRST